MEEAVAELLRLEPAALAGPVLDPCAGGDIDNVMSYPEVLRTKFNVAELVTMDIREDSRADICGKDFLSAALSPNFQLVISNPPFCYAESFVRRALGLVTDTGLVAFLFRINLLGANCRRSFWQEFPAKHIIVHSHRPTFTKPVKGKSGGDSCEYAHFVWQRGHTGPASLVVI